ncbi:hypothetical protein [Streptomyces sp. NBC_00620]|uniref:hypothetical protein n=1 Tax=Streptomyces sp. NBC_00620 TaxID=2903666 RepID=UPI00225BF1F1|nr:hypothetical protein [Streptomyces sp. NBC_00620]MCX4972407.1 hypothetical protein [Streptomyces sp. NBC_00620]
MTHELLAICDACKRPVADGEGTLWIDMTEVNEATVNERAWEQLEAEKLAPGVQSYSAESLMSYPDPARWRVHHAACDPAPNANAYAIEVHRCRTAGESAGARITPAVRPHVSR